MVNEDAIVAAMEPVYGLVHAAGALGVTELEVHRRGPFWAWPRAVRLAALAELHEDRRIVRRQVMPARGVGRPRCAWVAVDAGEAGEAGA